jgi:soluble calcium-activated nucleotidase 1
MLIFSQCEMNDWQRFGYNKPTNYYRLTQRIILKKLFKMILYGSIFFLAVFLLISKFIANDNENNLLPHEQDVSRQIFNSVYPLSAPVIDQIDGSIMYKLLAVADLDTKSRLVKTENKYSSYLLKGTLTLSENNKKAEIKFESQPTEISSQYSYGDRGMELSELVVFNGRLYTCDDRTGIVYEISLDKNLAIPWVILADGDGENTGKGFKCEWMAVKDKKLYVGGLGKEWTTPKGVPVNDHPQWIKVISHTGEIKHMSWANVYNKIRSELGFSFPGYMIFESCSWDEINQRWYFLPRRASNESYDEDLDEKRATNLLIYLDKDLMRVNHLKIGKVIPTRGYSSFKFVPNSSNQLIIALKSEENLGATRTFVNLFDVNGNILVKDILLSDNLKYEGIEFV